ncbi:MAG: methyltransferase domain-containing protein [Pseudonocardiaceae bacterium]
MQVIECVPDVAAALAELHRVVRPGGRVVVWDVDWSGRTAPIGGFRRMSR